MPRVLSDLPMATLSAMYLTNTITECIKSANANRLPPYTMIVCDIEPAEFYSETLKAKGLTSTIEPEG